MNDRRSVIRLSSALIVAAALVGTPPRTVAAQWELGPQAQYSNVFAGTWAVGARVNYHTGRAFALQATGDLYLPDCGNLGDCNLWDLQINGIFFLTRQQAYEPYLGAGFSFQNYKFPDLGQTSSTSASGPVAIIGSTLGFWGRTQPFLEGKWLFKGKDLSTQFTIQFGFTVELGRSY